MTSTISQNSPFPQSAVFPQNTYPQNTFPQSTYPPNTFPQNTFPQSTFPQNTFPQNTFPQSTFPQNSFSSQNSPYPQIQRNSSYQQNHFHPSVRQVQISSSSSLPSSASSASALFPLGTLPPSFDRSHLIDGIPVTYILEKLHLLGSTFYNDINSAHAELRVNSLPNSTFFVHKEYLILQSIFFRQIFERVKRGDCITITLPAAPETFQPILEYLYTGDDDKWYDTMTVESWSNISKNVSFLGLTPEAKAVCMTFYENYEDEIEQFLNRGGNERVTEGFGAAATHH